MQRIEIIHTTRYAYAQPVRFLPHKLHLRPREGHDIRIESSGLKISPAYEIAWQRDVYGNSVAIVQFSDKGDVLEIVSTVVVEQYEDAVVTLGLTEPARQFPFLYDPMEQIDLVPYQTAVFADQQAAVGEWLQDLCQPDSVTDTLRLLNELNARITNDIGYLVRDEPGVQSPVTTLDRGKGSCRDLATLFIEASRRCGLASRFVSGYLVSSAAVEDLATTHAWAEVYLPGAGWRGFDPTGGQLVGGDHIAVAVHRHPEAIPPVSGEFVGPLEPKPKMSVAVQVRRL
ncbi:MAG: transglutaminase family protein [Chromatiaceae bacterium]|jgi:transglutaminase-like putative cysteine protease|nr:transglutaminase family protein [Chromatiaceae bacterium]